MGRAEKFAMRLRSLLPSAGSSSRNVAELRRDYSAYRLRSREYRGVMAALDRLQVEADKLEDAICTYLQKWEGRCSR